VSNRRDSPRANCWKTWVGAVFLKSSMEMSNCDKEKIKKERQEEDKNILCWSWNKKDENVEDDILIDCYKKCKG
jgi:hypothetical protein